MCISLNFEFNHIYIIIGAIFGVIHTFIDEKYFNKLNDEPISERINQCFLAVCGQCVSFILYFIEKYFSKKEKINDKNIIINENENGNYNPLTKLRIENKKKDYKKIFILLIFSSFSDLMSWYFYSTGHISEYQYANVGWPLIIIFIYQKLLLKTSIYKHHYLIIMINFFLSCILAIYVSSGNLFKFFSFSFFYIYAYCFYSIYLCTEYYIYNTFIISPYLIVGLQGIIGIFLIIIEEIIRMFIGYSNIFYFIFNFNIKEFISIFLYGIVYICYIILVIRINPAVMGVIDCLEIIILSLMNENINWIKILFSFIFMILLMIFCEMIILNFGKLNENVKNNISIRAILIDKELISDYEKSILE